MIESLVNQETIRDILPLLFALPTILAFSSDIRRKILDRDGHKCTVCGSTEHLEASHTDHNRDNPLYNDPSNGKTLCTRDHLQDHIEREGRNGLNHHQNQWAINKIRERLK